jgi:Flp pilus assembly protein TadD
MYSNPLPSRHRSLGALTLGALLACALVGCASSPRIETRPVLATRGVDQGTDLKIAESALESGDTQLAASLFEKALKADPASRQAELGLADTIYQTGELARAGMLYAHVEASAPGDPRAELGLARVALRERRLDDALARYRRLVATHPDSAAAAEGLGAALDLQGKHGEAQAVYRAALARHPEAQGLKTNLGLSLILDRHAREGANVLLDVAGLPDAPVQARENLALAYGVLGNGQAAKSILTADMPAASADDNLLFYQRLRDRWTAQSGDLAHADDGGAATVRPVSAQPVSRSSALE